MYRTLYARGGRMTRRHIISCAAMAALLVGCGSGIRIRTDFDPATSFAGFDTYGWAQRTPTGDDDTRVYNSITEGRVKNAVNRALQAKGIREASSNPDFWVAWHGAIEGKMDSEVIRDHYGYGWGGWSGSSFIMTNSRVVQREWEEGMLLIDIIEPGNNQLVWRGTGQARLDSRPPTPEQAQSQMDEAAAKILESFPPGRGSQ